MPPSAPAHTPASFLPKEARVTHRDLRLGDFQHSCHSWDQPFCGSAQIFDAKSRREGILPQGGATCSLCVISCVVRYKLFKVQMIKLSLPIRGSTFKGASDRGRRIRKEDGAGAAAIFLYSWFRRQDALSLVGTDLFFQTTCTGHQGRERMNTVWQGPRRGMCLAIWGGHSDPSRSMKDTECTGCGEGNRFEPTKWKKAPWSP